MQLSSKKLNGPMKGYCCKICGNSEANVAHTVYEMMLGLREPFTYFMCANCGCLQINEIPKELRRYYTDHYYSFAPGKTTRNSSLNCKLVNVRDRYAVFGKGFWGRMLHGIWPNELLSLLSRVPITPESRILDIGCGQGELLRRLEFLGFTRLTGADPFIQDNLRPSASLEIRKSEIADLSGEWDLIMLHHSFEHLPDPLGALLSLSGLLSRRGVCLIRIPMIDSWAWRQYGVNFAQIDAPRHFFVHSRKSISILAGAAGFRIDATVEESSLFQFWASEQYTRGIPLSDPNSYGKNRETPIFAKSEISAFKKKSLELKVLGDGDQRAFFLVPA